MYVLHVLVKKDDEIVSGDRLFKLDVSYRL